MSSPPPPFRRRQIVVNKRLQYRYAVMIGLVLLFMLLLMEGHTWIIIHSAEKEMTAPELLEPIRSLQVWLLATGLVNMVVIPFLSLFISHRIAGPIYRLEKEVADALQNESFGKKIVLRQGDEFQSLADKISMLFERIHALKKSGK
jgi:signal transduction histidine kinase